MEFQELQAFVAVAEERSFSRAAVRLSRTQPAVSLAIRRLEDAVGERLFLRTSKLAQLTDAGELLLEYATRIFALREEARGALVDLRGLRRGDLAVGTSDTVAPALLPVVERFQAQYPDIRVDVRRTRGRELVSELRLGRLDFALTTRRPEETTIGALALVSDGSVVLVPPDHRFACHTGVSAAELATEPLIVSTARTKTSGAGAMSGLLASQRVVLGLPSIDAIKAAVERGMGVAVLPRSAATMEIAEGRLVAVPFGNDDGSRSVWLLWHARDRQSPAASCFLDVARVAASALERPRVVRVVKKYAAIGA